MSEEFGACLVLIPEPTGLAENVEGGEHITLAYFGDKNLTKEQQDYLTILAAGVARDFIAGTEIETTGVEYFGEDGDAVVLTLDAEFPTFVRDTFIDLLSAELLDIFGNAQTFPDYLPHMTMGYKSKGYNENDQEDIPRTIAVTGIGVWNGDVRITLPMSSDLVLSEDLSHEGVIRRSGRYPWGSGANPGQHSMSFKQHVEDLRKKGWKETDIAKSMEMTTTQLRARYSRTVSEEKAALQSQAQRLSDSGNSNVAIGRIMGLNESRVRDLLNPAKQARANELETVANVLREEVKQHRMLDVGTGTELYLGISSTKLSTALALLEDEGYRLDSFKQKQAGTGKDTTYKVLSEKDVTYKEIVNNKDKLQIPLHRPDPNKPGAFEILHKPIDVNPKRVTVKFGDEGGSDMDGVIELRRGVDDLSLGGKLYAQVRIAVGGDKYLKGMAIYSDDLPEGTDIRFNTNKTRADMVAAVGKGKGKTPELAAMKNQETKDPLNPFGSEIQRQKGALNIVNEEGGWSSWSNNLSSQMLSKQTPQLAKQQLELSYNIRKSDLDEIRAITNPTVKKKLLETYADGADSSATHLKAAALPRQGNHVILPVTSLKENEIYAPGYKNGEQLALVRHPHGGPFEIPVLTVNNRNVQARSFLQGAADAVGIHPRVAERLSGADFDGDHVLVIPNNKKGPLAVQSRPALKDLEGFDPKISYPKYDGMPAMTPRQKQQLMGDASNLITDMTIRGAPENEIARAVKYSMVVIDAEKHELNHKQARKDMGISALKKEYQGGPSRGASTVISQSSSPVTINERKPRSAANGGPIDKETGRLMWEPTGKTYVNKNGETVANTTKLSRMEFVDDAHSLSSGTVMETIYANHANRLKALANEARKEMISTGSLKTNPSAKVVYAPQVASLKSQLNTALKNAPLERKAQVVAGAEIKLKRQESPEMDNDELKKVRSIALKSARERTGARKTMIDIQPDEWEAIQNGAVSETTLRKILNNTDIDKIKELATPRLPTVVVPAKLAQAKAMLSRGYTQAEIAESLGINVKTLNSALLSSEE